MVIYKNIGEVNRKIVKKGVSMSMFKKLIFSLTLVSILILIILGSYSFAQIETKKPSLGNGNITVDFKDADITTVLRILSFKSGYNIVAGRDVHGTVTIRLVDVPWESALDTILATYGYTYERVGNVITVNEIEAFTTQKKKQQELFEVQPVVTEVFTMKYLNAADVKKVIDPMLSPKGRTAVLYMTGQKRWGIASAVGMAGGVGTEAATTGAIAGVDAEEEGLISKTLLVVDIPPYIERIRRTISSIDVKPRQVFIEARIVEVDRDTLRDIGFDIRSGAFADATIQLNPVDSSGSAGGSSFSSFATPAKFNPKSTDIKGKPGADGVFETGLTLLYRKLDGFKFEAMLHALEEDVKANVLSAPTIRTIDNQEASILVGTKYPILSGEAGTGETATATAELEYYQDIGIQLMVVPQINAEGYINMIVHPIVSTQSGTVSAGVSTGAIPIEYPILQVREAETQILMKSGETIVIGGLLADVKTKGRQGIPFLKDIPILGLLFGRDTIDNSKIDLLIFITAYIVGEEGMIESETVRYDVFKEVDKEYDKEFQKKDERIKAAERARSRTGRKQDLPPTINKPEPAANFIYGD